MGILGEGTWLGCILRYGIVIKGHAWMARDDGILKSGRKMLPCLTSCWYWIGSDGRGCDGGHGLGRNGVVSVSICIPHFITPNMTMLEARNKFKLRSLTVDCRAEDADVDAPISYPHSPMATADSWFWFRFRRRCRPSHGQQPQLNQKSVFICNGNDAALMSCHTEQSGANRVGHPLICLANRWLWYCIWIYRTYKAEPTPNWHLPRAIGWAITRYYA